MPDRQSWIKLLRWTADLLYPCHCALCSTSLKHGKSLCDECFNELPRLHAPFCEPCGEPFPGQIDRSFSCPNCHGIRFHFDFARPALVRDDLVLQLVHRLKYAREIHLAASLGHLAALAFDDPRLAVALNESWPLIPVPLHPSRLRKRHFNQAAEIARALSRHSGSPVLQAIRRTRNTSSQTRLSRKQRMQNLRGAFHITRSGRHASANGLPGAILIDDVLTTGSTVNECARVLRDAGVRKIAVITLMRG
ncbi:MAG: ComF family protein [Luteolibacter sp.]